MMIELMWCEQMLKEWKAGKRRQLSPKKVEQMKTFLKTHAPTHFAKLFPDELKLEVCDANTTKAIPCGRRARWWMRQEGYGWHPRCSLHSKDQERIPIVGKTVSSTPQS